MALIRVKEIKTGKTGTMDSSQYDPSVFERIDSTPAKTTTTQSTAQPQTGGGNILKNILGALVAPAVKAGKVIGGGAYELGRAGADVLGAKDVYSKQNPFLTEQELYQMGSGDQPLKDRIGRGAVDTSKTVAGIASYGVPGGGKLLSVLGKGALSGGLYGYGQSKPGEEIQDTLTSGISGAAGAGVLKGAGALTKLSGKGLTKAGEAITTNSFVTRFGKPSLTEGGTKIISSVNKLGLGKSKDAQELLEGAYTLYSSGGDELTNAIAKASKKASPISKNTVLSFIDNKIASENLPSNRLPWEAVKKDLAELPDNLSLEDFYKIKQDIGLKPNWNNVADKSLNNAYASVYDKMNRELDTALKGAGMTEFRNLNLKINSAKKVLDFATKRALNVPGTRGFGLKDLILGGAGVATGNPLTALLTIAGGKTLQSPTATNIVGSALNKVGGASSKLATPEALQKVAPSLVNALFGSVNQGRSETLPGQEKLSQEQPPLPTEQMAGISTPKLGTQQPIMTKEELALLTLLDPKNANAYKSIYELSSGESSGKLTETEKAGKAANQMASDALKLLQTKEIKTGLLNAPIQGGLAKFGAADQSTLEFNTLISGLKAAIAKARAGTSFTPNEEKLLNQYVPVAGDSRQQLETKLTLLQTPQGKSVLEVLMSPGITTQSNSSVDILQNAGINLQ